MNRTALVSLAVALAQDKKSLQIVTRYRPSSAEAQRAIKASRGSGFVFAQGTLCRWDTKAVGQRDDVLTISGPLEASIAAFDSGSSVERWEFAGDRGWNFLRTFVSFWAALHEQGELPDRFEAHRVCVWEYGEAFAFVLIPSALGEAMTLREEHVLPWESLRHPDAKGLDAWAFATAALAFELVHVSLPWSLDDVTEIRQEIRQLKPTALLDAYFPNASEDTFGVLRQAFAARAGANFVERAKTWCERTTYERLAREAEASEVDREKREKIAASRERARVRARFWKRRGTLVSVVSSFAALAVAVASWLVWENVKPYPNDGWEADRVVQGYYEALDGLDEQTIRQLAYPSFETGKVTRKDFDEVANVYVMKQVRTVYEKRSPIRSARTWLAEGRPKIHGSELLYGLVDVKIEPLGSHRYRVVYQKWLSSTNPDTHQAEIQGVLATDDLQLIKNNRGWKIGDLKRTLQPLP